MADPEALASYVAEATGELTREDMAKGANRMVPPPPKPGEYIVCQWCGKIMRPEDFSKDKKIRRYEFKWHIHYACQQAIWDQCDRGTSGLTTEREDGSRYNAYAHDVYEKNEKHKK